MERGHSCPRAPCGGKPPHSIKRHSLGAAMKPMLQYGTPLVSLLLFWAWTAGAQTRPSNEESPEKSLAAFDLRVEDALDENTVAFRRGEIVKVEDLLAKMAQAADLQIVPGEGVGGKLSTVPEKELTYRQVLDELLAENGFAWRRNPGTNLIWVTIDLVEETFRLSDEQYRSIVRLVSGSKKDPSTALRDRIYGISSAKQVAPEVSDRKFQLSGPVLRIKDTRKNLDRVKRFLRRYGVADTPPPLLLSGRTSGSDTGGRTVNGRDAVSIQGRRTGPTQRFYKAQHRTARDLGNAVQGLVLYSY